MAVNRAELIDRINKISFVMDDLRLFLDTHTQSKEALAMYHEMACARDKAIEEYTNDFGPMNAYDSFDSKEWKWVDYPWPWEGGC